MLRRFYLEYLALLDKLLRTKEISQCYKVIIKINNTSSLCSFEILYFFLFASSLIPETLYSCISRKTEKSISHNKNN